MENKRKNRERAEGSDKERGESGGRFWVNVTERDFLVSISLQVVITPPTNFSVL